MDHQNSKPQISGSGGEEGGGGGSVVVETAPTTDAAATKMGQTGQVQLLGFVLRSVAIIATFIATVVMGANKETRLLSVDGYYGVVYLTYKAVGNNRPQLEYFVAANALAFIYGSASLGLSIFKRRSPAKNLMLILSVVDILMLTLLFSAIGSASAIGVLYRQNGVNICNTYTKFCGSIAGSIVMSMLGSLAYLAIVFVNLVGLHNKCL